MDEEGSSDCGGPGLSLRKDSMDIGFFSVPARGLAGKVAVWDADTTSVFVGDVKNSLANTSHHTRAACESHTSTETANQSGMGDSVSAGV